MKWMLDTNICIAIINRRSERAYKRLLSLVPGDAGLSAVTMAELEFGVAKSLRVQQNREAVDGFILALEVAPFDASAAAAYGEVRASLQKRGLPIGALDMMIAGHALSLGVPLVTDNLKEFTRVPGLRTVNWLNRG